MEDNNKLFVFEKKEIVLIFVFVVLISVISFTLGVRTGKSLSLKHDQYSEQDIQSIDLKSVDEEYVDSVVASDKMENLESVPKPETSATEQMKLEQRLKEEMEKLASEKPEVQKNNSDTSQIENEITNELMNTDTTVDSMGKSKTSNQELSGKYTIQLFSHQSEQVAQDFADGFLAKGYDVIINEVAIPGKGKWYRVSIGIFSNVNEAKDYLDKEKSLFQNKNYIIQQF